MGDFFLDLRDAATRRPAAARAASLLQFCEATQVQVVERDAFSLVLARVDGFDLWGPAEHRSSAGNRFVALAGRIALDQSAWEAARPIPATGGLACKAILDFYQRGGTDALGTLNGNFVAFVHDESLRQLHIVTDRCGMFLAYHQDPLPAARIFSSHPDVLATGLGENQRLDLTSLAEFLTTGRLTFPYTYYQNLRALDTGCIHTINLGENHPKPKPPRRYFQFNFQTDPGVRESDLAVELAGAFRKAVHRRTLPLFGQSGVGLSGGLDSRAILSSARNGAPVRAFTLFDEENTELRTARALAKAARVDLTPLRRDFEYYGNAAELGVRISGGTGNIASNHFLGIRHKLTELGIHNLLTGCYCDYLLKGLALNTTETRFSRTERLAAFNFAFYHRCYWDRTRHRSAIEARLSARFPESAKSRLTREDWLNIEQKRAFPLAYEGDLAQRVIPQRIIPWYIPIVDNDLIDIYLRIPSHYKLNASLFKQMVLQLCDADIRRVPDSNTGAPLTASRPRYSMHRYLSALRNRLTEKIIPRMATNGSWPNWEYYLQHSRVLPALWQRKNPAAADLFAELVGEDPIRRSPAAFRGRDVEYFLRLFTLKLWFDQRLGG
jgi:asparagine synthase (glutamine-hydrolysing)